MTVLWKLVLWKFVLVGLVFGVSWLLLFKYALKDGEKISEKNEDIGTYVGRAVLFIGAAVCIGIFNVGHNKIFMNTNFLTYAIALDMLLTQLIAWNTACLKKEEGRNEWLGCINAARICNKLRYLSKTLWYIVGTAALFECTWGLYEAYENKEKIQNNFICIIILTLLLLIIFPIWKFLCCIEKKWIQRLCDILTIISILIFLILVFMMFYTFGRDL